jgi:hypothetical protein
MSSMTINDTDDVLHCEKSDEVIDGHFDPISGVLELQCPKCEAYVKAKLYSAKPIPESE